MEFVLFFSFILKFNVELRYGNVILGFICVRVFLYLFENRIYYFCNSLFLKLFICFVFFYYNKEMILIVR